MVLEKILLSLTQVFFQFSKAILVFQLKKKKATKPFMIHLSRKRGQRGGKAGSAHMTSVNVTAALMLLWRFKVTFQHDGA